MSVLLALLTFAVVMILAKLLSRQEHSSIKIPARNMPRPSSASLQKQFEREVPQGYRLHPCHMWAMPEGPQSVRVGLDDFACRLLGKIERVSVAGLHRWVRQGQRLMTIDAAGVSVDFPSPVEGTVMSINRAVVENPELMTSDPFCEGWTAIIKAPCFKTDQRNLMQGPMIASWMRSSMGLLRDMCSTSPVLAQDGGSPVIGVLNRVSPELRNEIIKRFFLTSPIEGSLGHPMSI